MWKSSALPKNTGNGYGSLRPDILQRTTTLKFLVSERDPNYADIPDVGQHTYNTPIHIQPMDEYDAAQNKRNYNHAVALTKQHGAKLSIQLHKILEIE